VSQDNRPLGFRLVALTMLGHPSGRNP
jgi:hypothetical protein